MSKRINAATSVPHFRVGCSTVAVSWAGIKCNAYLCLYVLPANRGKIGEPTSGLEPLTCSSYEFACARSSASLCVRKLPCLCGFSVDLANCFVHCVLACTSPVAVRLQYARMQVSLGM